MSETAMEDGVGPVLRMCAEVEQVVQAILDDNPERTVSMQDNGAYVRAQAPGRLRLTLTSLRRHLGADFEMRQLEPMLAAFAGRISTGSEEVVWSLNGGQGETS